MLYRFSLFRIFFHLCLSFFLSFLCHFICPISFLHFQFCRAFLLSSVVILSLRFFSYFFKKFSFAHFFSFFHNSLFLSLTYIYLLFYVVSFPFFSAMSFFKVLIRYFSYITFNLKSDYCLTYYLIKKMCFFYLIYFIHSTHLSLLLQRLFPLPT